MGNTGLIGSGRNWRVHSVPETRGQSAPIGACEPVDPPGAGRRDHHLRAGNDARDRARDNEPRAPDDTNHGTRSGHNTDHDSSFFAKHDAGDANLDHGPVHGAYNVTGYRAHDVGNDNRARNRSCPRRFNR